VEVLHRTLPPDLAERAHAYAAGGIATVEPRSAASVILLRDRPPAAGGGVEVYTLRRVPTMAFASRMHVFPGGSVDPRDADLAGGWVGDSPARWAARLGTDEQLAISLVCAAVRETFEESGVLLAGPHPGEVVGDTTSDEWEADRLALVSHALPFAELLERRGLVLRTDLLRPWARWVTPEFEPRRFDAWFFLAALPDGQRTRDVGGEADRVAWISPSAAVEAYARGEMAMLPPTIATFVDLASAVSVDAALALADGRSMAPVMPRPILTDGGGAYVVLPGETGYDA
jgi:8-oxo-dGTP pyrophosphatase MutT (NUDIX family)